MTVAAARAKAEISTVVTPSSGPGRYGRPFGKADS